MHAVKNPALAWLSKFLDVLKQHLLQRPDVWKEFVKVYNAYNCIDQRRRGDPIGSICSTAQCTAAGMPTFRDMLWDMLRSMLWPRQQAGPGPANSSGHPLMW